MHTTTTITTLLGFKKYFLSNRKFNMNGINKRYIVKNYSLISGVFVWGTIDVKIEVVKNM